MSDNTRLNPGSGGDQIASDDIGGIKYQRVKLVVGNDGVNDGDVSSTNKLPIDIDQPLTDAQLRATALDVNATINTTGLATDANQDVQLAALDSIIAKITSDPATQTTLAAILAKIISNPSTEAKQDAANTLLTTLSTKDFATQTTLAAILAKLIASPSTEAKQDTGNTSLSSIDTKLTNPLPVSGTISTGLSQPLTDTQIRATPLPVSGTVSTGLTQPLTDTQLRATPVPVSGTVTATPTGTQNVDLTANTIGLSTGAKQDTGNTSLASILAKIIAAPATEAKQDTGNTSLGTIKTNTDKIPSLGQALAASSVPVVLTAAQITTLTPISGSLEATQLLVKAKTDNLDVALSTRTKPADQQHTIVDSITAGSTIIGKVGIDQTTPGTTNKVNIGTDGTVAIGTALPAGSAAIGKLAANSGVIIGDVNVVAVPTLTKGTQGSTGFSVQPLNNAGRVALRFYAVAAAAGTTTTETAITLTKSADNGATSTAVSFVITSGKRFRITNIIVATRGNATATIQTTTFNLRINTAGAVITSTTPIILSARSATPATASAWDRLQLDIGDGIEILGDGTIQFGITAAATYTTNAPTWDVVIIGYEY